MATVERTVSRRKHGTIYVDYLQNIEGKTLACAYSARASRLPASPRRSRGTKCTAPCIPSSSQSPTVLARVREVGDLWAGTRDHEGADLLAALKIR